MNEKQIRLRSREEVQDFVQAASNCNFDIEPEVDRGKRKGNKNEHTNGSCFRISLYG